MRLNLQAILFIFSLVSSTVLVSAVEDPNNSNEVTAAHHLGAQSTIDNNKDFLQRQLDTTPTTAAKNEDVTVYNGLWGEWGKWSKVRSGGSYACGAEIRFEDPVSGDDTAANGLKLRYCGLHDWKLQTQMTVEEGVWGNWKSWVMCPYGKYIGGVRVRFEKSQSWGDDTALNGLAIYCVKKDWSELEEKTVYAGRWGEWKDWAYRRNKLVKGARVRFEGKQGSGDDTAMNGMHINVEVPNYGVSHKGIVGYWKDVGSGPQGGFSHKIKEFSQSTLNEEITQEESYGFTQSISAGFKIKVVDVSTEVSAHQSYSVSETMKTSLTKYEGTESMFSCRPSGSPTQYYTMWQFVMSQPSDEHGIGFTSETRHMYCTPDLSQPPRCVIGFCADEFCQECKSDPTGASYMKKYTGKWPHCVNLLCVTDKTRRQMELECNKDGRCDGISYSTGAPATGSGCLKVCGRNDSTNGYGYNTHDYWVKR